VALNHQVSPPQLSLSSEPPTAIDGTDVLAIAVLHDEDGPTLGPGGADLLDRTGLDVFTILEHHRATGKVGEVVAHPLDLDAAADGMRTLLLVGVGAGTPGELRRAGAALARACKGRSTVATGLAALADDAALRALVEGLVLGSFTFHRRSEQPASALPVETVVLAGVHEPEQRQAVLDRALAVAGAGWTSRALALTPSNEKNPAWMAEQASAIAAGSGLEVEVWDEQRLAREGFGGILGVGRASATPPRLIRLGYTPRGADRDTPHVVLVGKGITFDTGGLSLKPAEAMMNMKRDMTGGGVVLAVLAALEAVDCPVRVTGLVPTAENAVGGDALRPGDVIRHYGGRTSEIRNTDAEGRLVLADALAYAVAELEPDVLVDVATLTGAMKISLGQRTGGLFATDDALAEVIATAGKAAGEPLWRMPLVADYEERVKSKVADGDNAAGGPGAITAALFLQPFTGGLPWAHLDIASVGDSPVDAYEWTSGATGFGARALLHWLELREPLTGVAGVTG
jgi:leucyl aminopeptidase